MVHLCLDTNETLYLSVCTIDVYVCAFLGNEVSINQLMRYLITYLCLHTTVEILFVPYTRNMTFIGIVRKLCMAIYFTVWMLSGPLVHPGNQRNLFRWLELTSNHRGGVQCLIRHKPVLRWVFFRHLTLRWLYVEQSVSRKIIKRLIGWNKMFSTSSISSGLCIVWLCGVTNWPWSSSVGQLLNSSDHTWSENS